MKFASLYSKQIKDIPYINILNEYSKILLARFPDDLQRIILFGSQARGDASSESDIDLLTLVSWKEEKLPNGFYVDPYSDPRWQSIIEIAYDISLEHGVLLSPYVMSENRFAEWSPLVNEVKKEGIEIWKRN